MGFIYKLVDKLAMENAKMNIITFSHPIFEFKGSEGQFINFAKRIFDKYQKNGLNIIPSKRDLEDIKKWCDIYKKTYGSEFHELDINSETKIIFCGIMQGFCGYFTTANLCDEAIKKEYISKCGLKDKIAIVRIDEKAFDHLHWRAQKVDGDYVRFNGCVNDNMAFNGFMHPTEIIYKENYNDYNELLQLYNSDSLHKSSTWFKILSNKFEWQKEKRLVFVLRSLEGNSTRSGCTTVYRQNKPCLSWEDVVFGNIVDAIDYCSKGPRYIRMKLDEGEISIFPI